jgi:type I restriction-modification system DNA methylase subunit
MKVGIDFFLTPEKDAVIVVLSNKGSLRLVELSGKLTNTQHEIFAFWHNVANVSDKNALHTTIWESFKLSSLNKKFYEGIAESFTTLTQHLQKEGVEEQLANQFANRLHGRLLFLWFLRKKHIINEAKEYFSLGDWNDTEYYANTLSTLFFGILNNEDHKDVDSITPYLNGGLFDQGADGEYWKTRKPIFPTGFFKRLYSHFDSFNFTTDESTPEYEQIAIDPEMLGRIFESFLATLKTETGAQAKKANGAFYTPREIVSYMSRESLRQYLYTTLDASVSLKSSIDELLDRPDSEWALAGTNSKRDTVAKEDREHIMEALRNIRVLDPAVGSGAFPMGVLHKILSIFERLDPNFDSYETKLSILRNHI